MRHSEPSSTFSGFPEEPRRPVRRVAMISLHTSPLDQPGTGDAGGLNVYVVEVARRLAARGIDVDVFTRATSSRLDPMVTLDPLPPLTASSGALGSPGSPGSIDLDARVRVHHVHAGPFEGLTKDQLPAQLCVFARDVLRLEAAMPPGQFDVVHSHYWLSGQVGALARDRWGVPLVHSMHTMAKVKNESLAAGDTPEPAARVIGEEQVVEAADVLVANTDLEAKQLINLYDADPGRVEVVHPGVDTEVFAPLTADERALARLRRDLPPDALVLLFAGRIQPLKAPDVLLRAVAELLLRRPELRSRLVVPIVGGPSGSGLERPTALAALAAELGIDDVVRFVPPVPQHELAGWYAAATLVAVPSYNESFGLVAAEAQATGTPVVAAAVGGLTTVVRHNHSGLLVDTHDPRDWALALERVVADPLVRERLVGGALAQSQHFSWDATAAQTMAVYERAHALMRTEGATR